jgi:hypothetical protein
MVVFGYVFSVVIDVNKVDMHCHSIVILNAYSCQIPKAMTVWNPQLYVPSMTTNHIPRRRLAVLISLAVSSMCAQAASDGPAPADAADAAPVATVVVSARTGDYLGNHTASAAAPTQSSLSATEPQSIITRDFIELSVTPTAEYSRIVNIAPSLSGDSANGPGLSETKTTMRGFGDDQYNITFDGIPWGDTNNPAHHSTSFFPGSVPAPGTRRWQAHPTKAGNWPASATAPCS